MRTVAAPWSVCAQDVAARGRSEASHAGVGVRGETGAVPLKDGESPSGTAFKNKNSKNSLHTLMNSIEML